MFSKLEIERPKLLTVFAVFFGWPLCFSASVNAASLNFLDGSGQAVSEILYGEIPTISVDGLTPDAEISIRCGNSETTSNAFFKSNSKGEVRLDRDAPISGSYRGVDASGIWWSRSSTSSPIGPYYYDNVCLAEQGTKELARAKIRFLYGQTTGQAEELTVAKDGFRGRIVRPNGSGPFPVVISLGGSEGGLSRNSEYFAAREFAGIDVAYFNETGLPTSLRRIPLEYFGGVFDWIKKQKDLDPNRIAIVGTSRGGELALLLGTKFPLIKAVVSIVGSGLVWAGPDLGGTAASSWTWQGQDVGFMPSPDIPTTMIRLPSGDLASDPSADVYEWLKDLKSQATAAIETEKINAPVLLLGSGDDHLWPSCLLHQIAVDRMLAHGHAFPDQALCFANAGHLLNFPGVSSAKRTYASAHGLLYVGGTADGTGLAQNMAWKAVNDFLSRHLRAGVP